MADALNGAVEAQNCSVAPSAALLQPSRPVLPPAAANLLYVDATAGSDANPGTITAPLQTIGKVGDGRCVAVLLFEWVYACYPVCVIVRLFRLPAQAVSVSRGLSAPKTIFLRAGTFYLPDTILLGPSDNGLAISAYNGEAVRVCAPACVRARVCAHVCLMCVCVGGCVWRHPPFPLLEALQHSAH